MRLRRGRGRVWQTRLVGRRLGWQRYSDSLLRRGLLTRRPLASGLVERLLRRGLRQRRQAVTVGRRRIARMQAWRHRRRWVDLGHWSGRRRMVDRGLKPVRMQTVGWVSRPARMQKVD